VAAWRSCRVRTLRFFRHRGAEVHGFEQEWTFDRIYQLQEQSILRAENAEVVHVPLFRPQTRRRGRLEELLKPRLKRDADAMVARRVGKKE